MPFHPSGFSFGQSSGSSQASSASSGRSFVDPNQQGFLDFIRNQGQQLFGQQQGGLQGLFGQAQGLFGQGQQFAQQGVNNQFLSALGQQAGGNPELVAAQTQQLGQDIGQFTREQVLPGIRRGAVGGNALGGGRQGVGEGIAGQEAIRAFSRGAIDFQGQDANRSLQAAQSGGGLLGQGAAQGLGSLGQQFGLLNAPFQSQFSPLMQLAQIIGGPTVLNQQQAQSQSSAERSSLQFGFGGS